MATNWRRKWAIAGWTPYYYFYPDSLDGPLNVSPYATTMGWISVLLWVLFLATFISWWWIWWDWLYIVWIVLLVGIFVEWGVGYGIVYYFEDEDKKKRLNISNKKKENSTDTTPMKMKTTVQLKSLKMQL